MTIQDQELVDQVRSVLAQIEADKRVIEEKEQATREYLNRLTSQDGASDSNGDSTPRSNSHRRTRRSAEKRMQDIEDFVRENGGQVPQRQIRQDLDLDTGTTTKLVQRLTEDGRVKIKREGRSNLVSIARSTRVKPGEGTERGRQVTAD